MYFHMFPNRSHCFLIGLHNVLKILNRNHRQPDKSLISKKVSEYDQEIPQSQTADNPVAPRGRAAQPSRDTRKTKKAKQSALLPHQDDCNTRMDIK